ncbi:sulfotransferase domain-containing protein [Streptomyces sp. NPDC059788]|uniref:sulfotransferase domain-containing protein n=1 Tax=Streptomyces sp. NPDC059788 TaxID=3346948 RepID=UPI003656BC69
MTDAQPQNLFQRHRRNAARLDERDVVIAGYPASGSALLGNILIELGLGYVDPYTEEVKADGTTAVVGDLVDFRHRLAATAARDHGQLAGDAAAEDEPRFFRNHLYPEHFDHDRLGGAVLLVRDPRDAVYSSYKFFNRFAPRLLPDRLKGQGTFAEFLDDVGINEEPPVEGWTGFCRSWHTALPGFRRSAVVRFEDLKADPEAATAALLTAFGVTRTPEAIARATGRSSYDRMRAHEEKVSAVHDATGADGPRIMRRGKVGEWREWYGDERLAARFREPGLTETAALFGYALT